jgi:hypothetical protein
MTKEIRKRPQAPTRSKAAAQIPSGPIRSELNIIAQLIDRLTLSRRPPKRAGSALCNHLRTLGELQFHPRQPDTNPDKTVGKTGMLKQGDSRKS